MTQEDWNQLSRDDGAKGFLEAVCARLYSNATLIKNDSRYATDESLLFFFDSSQMGLLKTLGGSAI